ncbi:MAG: PPC domain-containing DNA-binding protein [Elusimicrobiota bacterium]
MKQVIIKVNEGEKLIETLEKELKNRGIKRGFIVTMVGALKKFSIVTIKQDSEEIPPENFEKKFEKKVELTGNGMIEKGKVHIHMAGGEEGGRAVSGHLVEGTVTHFAKVGIIVV